LENKLKKSGALKMSNIIRNNRGFFSGLVTGGLLGGLAALLYAPQTGKKLRMEISEKTDDILFETNLIVENAKEKASEIIRDATKKAESLIKDAGKKIESSLNCTDELITQGKDKISESLSKVKDAVKNGSDFVSKNIN
jgi:gas vesicle protein